MTSGCLVSEPDCLLKPAPCHRQGGRPAIFWELDGEGCPTVHPAAHTNFTSLRLHNTGNDVYPLIRTVINIGRRPDNDLVIDDARISRVHAQLRALHQHYVVFDLGSSGGTRVNGEPVNQHVLSPGDVISLAGLPLVYGQDLPGGDTQSLPSFP